MWSSDDALKGLRIASPCSAKWENMPGDDRVRHCASCDLNVFNFAAMTRSEIGELLMRTEGRVCARLYQRADGTLLTSDCPSGLRARRRRRLRLRTAALAALLGLSLPSACTTAPKARLTKHSSVKLRVAPAQETSFVGVVRDETGIPLPGVTVVVRDATTHGEIEAVTDIDGAFALPSMKAGTYRVEVSLAGLEPMVKDVTLNDNEVVRAQVTLRFATSMTVTVGAIVVDPMAMNGGIATTFPKEFIDKLPIGN